MNRSPISRFRHLIIPSLTLACVAALVQGASAQTPILQYNFNSASGANTGSSSPTGVLSAVGVATFTGAGVSGAAGDSALSTNNNYTNTAAPGGTFSSATTSAANVGTLNTFTLTMWVNVTTAGDFANFGRLFQIGSSTNPDNVNPGIYLSLNNGQLQYGVNGATTTQTVGVLNTGNTGKYIFLALAYDGTSGGSFNSGANNTAYGTYNNLVLLSGDTMTSATAGNSVGLNSNATSTGPIALGTAATIFLGNRSANDRGTTGLFDDIRLYNSELSISQIDAIRQSAVVVPEPGSIALVVLGAFVGVVFLRRRLVATAI